MDHFHKIKLPFEFLKNDVSLPNFDTPIWWYWTYADLRSSLSDEALSFIKDTLKLKNPEIQAFRGMPGKQVRIHVDSEVAPTGEVFGKTWALNYVWNASDSDMVWYKPIISKISSAGAIGPNRVNYQTYDINEVEEIERVSFSGLALVRIDIPHAVFNKDPQNPRYCFSIRDRDQNLSWEEAVSKFSKWIV